MNTNPAYLKRLLPLVKDDKIEEFVKAFTDIPKEPNPHITEAEVLAVYGYITEWAMIYFGISDRDIKSKSRLNSIVMVRQTAIYALHNHFQGRISLEKTGMIFNRDHATVIYAIRKCQNAMYDKKIASYLVSLHEYLQERSITSLNKICQTLQHGK